jgi:hypothetical protein
MSQPPLIGSVGVVELGGGGLAVVVGLNVGGLDVNETMSTGIVEESGVAGTKYVVV